MRLGDSFQLRDIGNATGSSMESGRLGSHAVSHETAPTSTSHSLVSPQSNHNHDLPQATSGVPHELESGASNETSTEGVPRHRPLNRQLGPLHIFMIAISTIIGIGYYVRTGIILHIGGPGAVVYSYLFLGLLTLMVTRNLTVMLRIWPISGAMAAFVKCFVDPEVAKAMSWMYWLSFSFSFASLTTVVGDLVDFFNGGTEIAVIVSIVTIVTSIGFNLLDIKIFRWVEVGFGSLKMILALVIIIIMNILNPLVGSSEALNSQASNTNKVLVPREVIFQQGDSRGGWFASIAASIFIASFSILGVEIVAAAAQEAKFESGAPQVDTEANHIDTPGHDNGSDASNEGSRINPFRYAMLIPAVAAGIYVWGGWIASENIDWKDPRLPTLAWNVSEVQGGNSSSLFVSIADDAPEIPNMPQALTALLIINIMSTCSSVLYVASRTLFGIGYTTAVKLQVRESKTWKYELAALLSKTTRKDVPWVAVLISAWLSWLPFLKYTSGQTFNTAVNVVTEIASVACILVWALLSLAAFRFYRCAKQEFLRGALPDDIFNVARVWDTSWYCIHLALAASSLALCLAVVFVGGAMILLLNIDPLQGVAAFSMPVVLFVLTCVFKFNKGGLSALGSWGSDLTGAVHEVWSDLAVPT